MGSKIVTLASGMIIGMAVLVMCEPMYQKLTDKKDDIMNCSKNAKRKAESSLASVKQKISLKTDNALDKVTSDIEELTKLIESIDISKLKGKSRMALEDMKQKIMNLKQD